MEEKIIYATLDVGGEPVRLTSAFHVRRVVNEVNKRAILTSNFYRDIAGEDDAPYLKAEMALIRHIQSAMPSQYQQVLAELEELGAIKRLSASTTVLTEQAVRDIFYVYKIDHRTLLQGGPKIPVKQNNLFGSSTPEQTDEPEAQRRANLLFPPDEVNTKRVKRVGGRRTRLTKPGVSINDDKSYSLINLSKALMPLVYDIPYIESQLDSNRHTVNADVKVAVVEGKKIIGIKFHEAGEFEFFMKRNNSVDYRLSNISIDKKRSSRSSYKKLLTLLKKHNLLETDHISPEIAGDTVMFTLPGLW